MNRCPISYEACGHHRYSTRGLHRLSRSLDRLEPSPYTQEEQLREAAARADKMSIQGVQPKLSAVLEVRRRTFAIVDRGGTYILKPQSPHYPHLPENEDVTMRLAASCGIEVPFHCLLYTVDGTWTYCIRRFDREPGGHRLALEDFAQLTGATRETKYDARMEQVAHVVERFCTFPMVEKARLFRLVLFNFLVGNEDMHLKNFSLITRAGKTLLSPAYDLLNSSIALRRPREEIALPLHGKRARLRRDDLVEYYGQERLGLQRKSIEGTLAKFEQALPRCCELVRASFLPAALKTRYFELMGKRCAILGWTLPHWSG